MSMKKETSRRARQARNTDQTAQVREPAVLVHATNEEHPPFVVAHSFTSVQLTPSPVYPPGLSTKNRRNNEHEQMKPVAGQGKRETQTRQHKFESPLCWSTRQVWSTRHS